MPVAGEDEIFGARRRGKGTHIVLSITQQPEAAHGRVGEFRLPSKAQFCPCGWPRGAGEFQGGNKSQMLLKKDISCSRGLPGEGKGRCVVTAGRAEL